MNRVLINERVMQQMNADALFVKMYGLHKVWTMEEAAFCGVQPSFPICANKNKK